MFQGITPTPDSGFLRKLKEIDPNLGCEFSREYGRFVITQVGKISGRVPVAIVEGDEGGGYRYPDNRDIRMLHEADRHRAGNEYKDVIQRGEEQMLKVKEAEEKRERDEIRNATKDDKLQLAEAYHEAFNLPGKGPKSAFRRIEHKPKGYVVNDNRKFARN